MKKNRSVEDILYRAGLTAVLVAAVGCLFWLCLPESVKGYLVFPCVIRRLSGFYCPGCGGTRALQALFGGNLIKSIYYHPFVLYGFALFLCFMLSHTLSILTRGKIAGMRYHNYYAYIGAFLVTANFIVKNILYLIYRVDILV